MTRICVECGAEFTVNPKHPVQKYCSKVCANNATPTIVCARAHACGRLIPNSAIMAAARKPQGVSPVRWRMELRRRANPERYAMTGVVI